MSPEATLLERLEQLAANLWWTWNPDVISLFRDLDPSLWRQVNHNPLALLREIDPAVLRHHAQLTALDSRVNFAFRRLEEYRREQRTWGRQNTGPLWVQPVAYFVAEFGLHESLPLYSGGLGVLAGDTLKSASDLDVPLVGVGIFYAQSYFQQQLDRDGNQTESYGDADLSRLPLSRATTPDGRPLSVSVQIGQGVIHAGVWRARVGRVTLVLLNTDVDENNEEDRSLTRRLYGGDRSTRLRQEMILGIGGLRALRALGLSPGVLHLNEGHSAFATLERIRERMEGDDLSFDAAARETVQRVVFTTHTPVEAGHDRFEPELIETYLGWMRERLGLSTGAFLGLGRVDPGNQAETFCMTVLALKLSRFANAVSSLHGHISRRMWLDLWPNRTENEIPIGHITNGVHLPSWVAPGMNSLFQRHIGHDWNAHSCRPEAWEGIDQVNDTELWEVHQTQRQRLVNFVRRRLVRECERRQEPDDAVAQAARALRPEALTIGFARRFVTYKRATLLLSDPDRLARLVNDPDRPVQLIFSGKAHPQDQGGKGIIRTIVELCRDDRFRGKLVFVEDYDINVARHMVQGADVWLNNPLRPLEACGTSGQKAAVNGVLNLSVLDGWWAEAYDGHNGFAVGGWQTHSNAEVQYRRDAESLFNVLENRVVPLFYDRDQAGLPLRWIRSMKRSIQTLAWRFNADRMMMDYVLKAYVPAAGGTSCEM